MQMTQNLKKRGKQLSETVGIVGAETFSCVPLLWDRIIHRRHTRFGLTHPKDTSDGSSSGLHTDLHLFTEKRGETATSEMCISAKYAGSEPSCRAPITPQP